jgi:hypothetical protein
MLPDGEALGEYFQVNDLVYSSSRKLRN